jgi:hypothetical protein
MTFPKALVGRQLPKTVQATDETITAEVWACLARSGALLAVGGTPIGRCDRLLYYYTQEENIKHCNELVHSANAFRTSDCNSSFTITCMCIYRIPKQGSIPGLWIVVIYLDLHRRHTDWIQNTHFESEEWTRQPSQQNIGTDSLHPMFTLTSFACSFSPSISF